MLADLLVKIFLALYAYKNHCRVTNSTPLDPTVSQLNSVTASHDSLNIYHHHPFINSVHRSIKLYFLLRFPD
jgi:hypothetical protein